MAARFALGRLLATPGALRALEVAGVLPFALLARHHGGEWGDLSPEDHRANDRALRDGSRLFSAYVLPTGVQVWVITEAEPRAATTLLLPEEY